jgi:hypothetical protein
LEFFGRRNVAKDRQLLKAAPLISLTELGKSILFKE